MPLVIIGVLLVAAKVAGWGPVGDWPWWWVLAPFGAAAVWWAVADATGITQRRAMQKMEDRKTKRRERAMADLGLDTRRHPPAAAAAPKAGPRKASAPTASPAAPREPRL